MSLQTSTPSSSSLITKEISTRTMSDMVKDFNIEELIKYLGRKDLKLNEDDIKIFHKEKVAGHDFFKLTKEKLEYYRIKRELATRFVDFIKGLSQKLQNYFLLKTLNNLKKMLHKNKMNGENITNIKQFTPSR